MKKAILSLLVFSMAHADQYPCEPSPCCPPKIDLCGEDFLTSYIGASIGYGRIRARENVVADLLEGELESLFDTIISTNQAGIDSVYDRKGGVSYRGLAGAVYTISQVVKLGGELSFSYYPSTKVRAQISFTGDTATTTIVADIKSWGYGLDILGQVQFVWRDVVYASILPGFQFARQKNILHESLKITGASDGITSLKATVGEFEPEIVLKLHVRPFKTDLVRVGGTYQHVFSSHQDRGIKSIGQRDMVTFDIVFAF